MSLLRGLGACGVGITIFSVVLCIWLPKPASGAHATAQCVQVGQANANTKKIFRFDNPLRFGPYSIGTEKFDTKYTFLDFSVSTKDCWDNTTKNLNSPCPYPVDKCNGTDQHIFFEPCPLDSVVEIRTYAVEQDGKIMNGWLHFEVELMDKTDKILAIYVQVRDKYFNAVGEFVGKKEEQCPAVRKTLVTQPNEYQVLPCSAVGFREPKLAHALFMVDESILKDPTKKSFMPNETISEGIHFTWRLSEYWCNRHLRIRPEAIIFTEKILKVGVRNSSNPADPKVYRKAANYWINLGWYGTADIKLPATKLTCDKEVIDYIKGTMLNDSTTGKLVAPWLTDTSTQSILENDYMAPHQWYSESDSLTDPNSTTPTMRSCQVNVRLLRPENCTAVPNTLIPSFAGRCTNHFDKKPAHDALQGCNLDQNGEEFKEVLKKYPNMPTYTGFVNTLYTNRSKYCDLACHVPNASNVVEIQNFTDTSNESVFTSQIRYNTDNRNQSKIEKFFVGRRYHAVLCVLWTLLLTPIGIFCARYLKETCMQIKCTGIHFWFWVHLATTIGSAGLFVSSLTALHSNISTWGRSEHPMGSAHRILGYLSITLFSVMLLIGGLRGLNRTHRLITATLHSVIGFLIYIMNLMAIFVSCFIPASPSMDECNLETGDAKGTSGLFYVALVWLITDMGVHVGMSVLQYFKDRDAGVRRPWWCPIFPFLPHDSADDMIGSKLRKLALLIYAGGAFIFTNTAMGLLLDSKLSDDCKALIGPTSCKETWECSNSARAFSKFLEKASSTSNGSYTYGS